MPTLVYCVQRWLCLLSRVGRFWWWHLPGGVGNRPDLWHSAWDLAAELNHCGSPWWGSCAVTGLEIGEEFTSRCQTLYNNQGKQAEAGGASSLALAAWQLRKQGWELSAGALKFSATLLWEWVSGWPSQSWHQNLLRYKQQPSNF